MILVVDDEPDNLKLLQQILGEMYELKFAKNGKSALAAAKKHNPDLILLDIMMPEMDGYEVCSELKDMEETANKPIIFVTARNEIEDEQKGLELGAVDYLTKPLNPAIVRARVKNHLLIKHQRDQLEKSISTLQHEAELLQQKAELGIQAGGLAHDMANILTGICLLKYIPRTQPKDLPEWQETIEDIDSALGSVELGIEVCRGFTNYLKDIGEEATVHSFVEFLPSINMYAKQFRGELVREINDDISQIKCKGYQIKRILINLFMNAIQAVENQKDPKIILHLWSKQDRVLFSIKDNGTGISPKVLPDIFEERFTTKAKGTGLGLFLTKQIMDAHEGTVEVISEENKGSEFIISFPAHRDEGNN